MAIVINFSHFRPEYKQFYDGMEEYISKGFHSAPFLPEINGRRGILLLTLECPLEVILSGGQDSSRVYKRTVTPIPVALKLTVTSTTLV